MKKNITLYVYLVLLSGFGICQASRANSFKGLVARASKNSAVSRLAGVFSPSRRLFAGTSESTAWLIAPKDRGNRGGNDGSSSTSHSQNKTGLLGALLVSSAVYGVTSADDKSIHEQNLPDWAQWRDEWDIRRYGKIGCADPKKIGFYNHSCNCVEYSLESLRKAYSAILFDKEQKESSWFLSSSNESIEYEHVLNMLFHVSRLQSYSARILSMTPSLAKDRDARKLVYVKKIAVEIAPEIKKAIKFLNEPRVKAILANGKHKKDIIEMQLQLSSEKTNQFFETCSTLQKEFEANNNNDSAKK